MRALLIAFFVPAACGLLFSISWPVFANSARPDGPGTEVTVEAGAHCHAPEMVASVRLTRDGWQATIAAMLQQGARASDQKTFDGTAPGLDYQPIGAHTDRLVCQ